MHIICILSECSSAFILFWFLSRSGVSAKPTTSSSEQGEEKKKVPVIPFGLDLYYWGEEQPTAGKIIKYSSNSSLQSPIIELRQYCFMFIYVK